MHLVEEGSKADCYSYTDNPRNNPDAKPVYVVRDIEKVKQSGK